MTATLKLSRVFGSTDSFYGNVKVYKNVDWFSDINNQCILDNGYIRYHYANNTHSINNPRNVSKLGVPGVMITQIGGSGSNLFQLGTNVQTPGYLYDIQGGNLIERKLADLSKLTIAATYGSDPSFATGPAAIGPRQVAMVNDVDVLYQFDFASNTFGVLHDFDVPGAIWTGRYLTSVAYKGKIYAFYYGFFTVGGVPERRLYCYNVTDDVEVLNWAESITTGAQYYPVSQSIYHFENYVALVTSVPYLQVYPTHGEYHDLRVTIYNLESGLLTNYDYEYRAYPYSSTKYGLSVPVVGIDPVAGNLVMAVQSGRYGDWKELKFVTYNFASHAFSKRTPYLDGAIFHPIQGTQELYFYDDQSGDVFDKDGTKIYETMLPTLGLGGVSQAYDDNEGRIWVADASEHILRGYRMSDGDCRTIDCSSVFATFGSNNLLISNEIFLIWNRAVPGYSYAISK